MYKHKWEYEEYSRWSRQLSRLHTLKELEDMLWVCEGKRTKYAMSHLGAIQKSTSMQGNGQHRAQARNNVSGNYEKTTAIKNAIELYEYYPEQCNPEHSPQSNPE
jgi:hypothetical protein